MTKLMEKIKRTRKSSAEPTNEPTSLVPAARASEQYQRWRRTGVTIQIVLFISNGGVWVSSVISSDKVNGKKLNYIPHAQVISILAIVGGFIVGLNTKTINIRLELLDLTVTTPATIFITYGLIIVLASILGCFTATGGNVWITIGVRNRSEKLLNTTFAARSSINLFYSSFVQELSS